MQNLRKLKERKLKLLKEKQRRQRLRRLFTYFPETGPHRRELYLKHGEFFEAGADHRERCFMAANRVGKTESAGGYETVLHLTGRYPDWWKGRRFDKPIRAWAAGDTTETVKDILQRKLLGKWDEFGTGLIPGEDLHRWTPKPNVREAVDTIYVKHDSGGVSELKLKSYEQGRKKFQGTEIDLIWLDEEPPEDIYGECLIRTMTTGGLLMITFTPLSGMTGVVLSFMEDGSGQKFLVQAGWDDVPHLDEEAKAELRAGLPPHEIEARSKGIPSLGSGRVFPVDENDIKVTPFAFPDHWPRIGALDFGWDHPTAAVELVWDRDTDTVYVARAYRKREATPAEHAPVLLKWGDWLPWAWPHDGYQHDKGSGQQLRKQYQEEGLNMIFEQATHADGGNGVEAGIMDMLTRMQEGRLRVFANLAEWFEEFRLYHRQDGKIVKLRDDIMSATRYGVMMLRYAETAPITHENHSHAIAAYTPEF